MIRFTLNGEKFEFDDNRLSNLEAMQVKKVTVDHWQPSEMFEAFRTGDVEACTVVAWLARRRAGEDVKFSEVEFDLVEFWDSIESDNAEETDAEADPPKPDETPETPSS